MGDSLERWLAAIDNPPRAGSFPPRAPPLRSLTATSSHAPTPSSERLRAPARRHACARAECRAVGADRARYRGSHRAPRSRVRCPRCPRRTHREARRGLRVDGGTRVAQARRLSPVQRHPEQHDPQVEGGRGALGVHPPAGYAVGSTPPGRELGTNGLTFDARGMLVVPDHGNRAISRWNDSLFARTVVVDRFEGKRFNSPNDLVWGPNGDLYFTDPSYGLRGLNSSPVKELPFNGVYRLTPSGQLSVVTRDLTFPNGIALSPDARTLYVAISDPRNPYIMSYPVNADGSTGAGRTFYDARERVRQGLRGGLDGLKVDAKGNIFATGPGGILVLSPAGKHLGTIVPGDLVANCAFGDDGSTLYMTVNRQLMRVRTLTKGHGF